MLLQRPKSIANGVITLQTRACWQVIRDSYLRDALRFQCAEGKDNQSRKIPSMLVRGHLRRSTKENYALF